MCVLLQAWGLQDHGAEQVPCMSPINPFSILLFPYQLPLTWESAQVLLEFYHPSFLPAVEENKTLTPEVASHLTPHNLTLSHSHSSTAGVSISQAGGRDP